MGHNLTALQEAHKGWYDTIVNANHNDVLAYYDLCFSAMSNNARAQDAVSAAFPGCRKAVADWYAIESACAELMTGMEIDTASSRSEQILNSVRLGGAGAENAYEQIIDRGTSKLRTLRISKGYTLQALADKSGVNIRQIQRIESGDSKPDNITLGNAIRISDALGVQPKDLL